MKHFWRLIAFAIMASLVIRMPVGAEENPVLFPGLDQPTPSPTQSLPTTSNDWYRDAVIYHIWVAAFRDSNGDGVGDIRGITESLDTLQQLGVSTLWLSPFFECASSNRNLHGYDVVNHFQVDRRFGENADIDELIRQAHSKDMRLIFDFVPNHLSSRHPWFIESQDPNSAKRDWFVWRDERPENGWTGFDERSDWHPLGDDYYYGIFWSGMPDVNHHNPEVRLELARVARHWLDRGFDGMRVDAIRYLYENLEGKGVRSDQEDQPQSRRWFAAWRHEVLEPYSDLGYAKFMMAENWTEELVSLESYLSYGDRSMFHMTLNFALLPALTQLDASAARTIWKWGASLPEHASLGNFVSNHDLAADRPGSLFIDEPQKLRAQAAWLLLGPGTPIIYYGNEIGQPQGNQGGDTKHRQPLDWVELARQQTRSDSLWHWHRQLIAIREQHASLRRGPVEFLPIDVPSDQAIAMLRQTTGDATITIFSAHPEPIVDLSISLPPSVGDRTWRSTFDGQSLRANDAGILKIATLNGFGIEVLH